MTSPPENTAPSGKPETDIVFCCERMSGQIWDAIIRYDPRFGNFSIVVREDADTVTTQDIDYCPWCAARLPDSLRDRWFDELETLGIDPMNDLIPERYRSDAWRRPK
jgi:hypothetical protein